MKEFQIKGTNLLKQFSEKDAMGEPKMEAVSKDRSSYVLAESTKADFLSKYAALKEEYSKAIDAQDTNQKEYRERLGKKASALKLYIFSKDELPKTITAAQLRLLFSVGMVKI
jgi:hypothetical protein